jgi:hypothetical protein
LPDLGYKNYYLEMLNKVVRFEVAVWRFKLVTMSNKQAPNRMWNWRVVSIDEGEKVTSFFLRRATDNLQQLFRLGTGRFSPSDP